MKIWLHFHFTHALEFDSRPTDQSKEEPARQRWNLLPKTLTSDGQMVRIVFFLAFVGAIKHAKTWILVFRVSFCSSGCCWRICTRWRSYHLRASNMHHFRHFIIPVHIENHRKSNANLCTFTVQMAGWKPLHTHRGVTTKELNTLCNNTEFMLRPKQAIIFTSQSPEWLARRKW